MEICSAETGCLAWLADHAERTPEEIAKATPETRAWFATVEGSPIFAKWYPPERKAWAAVEETIAGTVRHAAIVPLRQIVHGTDGDLFLYDRVNGENLAPSEIRARFAKLPMEERLPAIIRIVEALASVSEAGYTIVDWYDGNTIYDFDASEIWLFDWELCRPGDGFELEMDSNYGSSKLMAPEEFIRGSRIDQATTVFNVGRYAMLAVPEIAERAAPVLARANVSGARGAVRNAERVRRCSPSQPRSCVINAGVPSLDTPYFAANLSVPL